MTHGRDSGARDGPTLDEVARRCCEVLGIERHGLGKHVFAALLVVQDVELAEMRRRLARYLNEQGLGAHVAAALAALEPSLTLYPDDYGPRPGPVRFQPRRAGPHILDGP